jgi:hypothetical protein
MRSTTRRGLSLEAWVYRCRRDVDAVEAIDYGREIEISRLIDLVGEDVASLPLALAHVISDGVPGVDVSVI